MSGNKKWLVISLVLNVFLLGAMGGGLYSWTSWTTRHHAVEQRGLRFAAAELPKNKQREFKAALRDMRRSDSRQEMVRTARAARLDIIAALASPQFDPATLNAALARTREADAALRTQTETVVANFAMTLTPEERLKLVDGMERRGPLRIGFSQKP